MATGMATERCPSCGGAVRAGDPWCTLCWTDLRAKPVPTPVPAAPPAAPVPVPAAAPYAAPPAPVPAAPVPAAPVPAAPVPAAPPPAGPPVDPLTAPLTAVLGQPLAADPDAPSAPTWPCVECGARNGLDLDACHVCTSPFGGRITRVDDPKGTRRKTMIRSLGAVGAFLLLLAVVTFALTDTSGIAPPAPAPEEIETEFILPEG